MGKITDILKTMEYGPSPEASDAVRAGWRVTRPASGISSAAGSRLRASCSRSATPPPARRSPASRKARRADIDAAVAAARAAQAAWAALPGHERARHLYALARLTQKRERFLSVLESLDNGKPIRETRDIDVPLVARHFYHHAGWASLIASEFPNARPVGVCGQIIPWNFPLLMLAWKVAPALACGNTVVLKPAEYTPLTALAFAEICLEAGLPPGVVNIVTGDGATGAALVAHEGVDKIAFTGSTEVGRLIRRATAGSGKRLSLELGGKSPFIVFDDADLDSAAEGVVDGIFFNQGQVCCAGSRLLVAESIEARFLARLKARMGTLTVGAPLDKSTDIGAIVHPTQLQRIRGLVEAGRAEGAEIFQPETKLPAAGSFFPPTLACGVEPANILAREEVFGPVLATMTFRTPDEAVSLANNTRFGLAASVWTENVNRAYEVASRLKAGVVWINSTNLFDAGAAFGGYRESGFGREGGREGLAEYLVLSPLARVAPATGKSAPLSAAPGPAPAAPGLDRTPKMYIGGKQARPDGGAVYSVLDPTGKAVGQAGLGNRKDIRNAVEAASKASGWAGATAHNRAQVIYYIAENLSARAAEFAARLAAMTGAGRARRGRGGHTPAVLLRRLRRQIRRRGARDAEEVRDAGDERALRRDGNRLPGRGAAARLRLAGRAGDRGRQRGRRRSERRPSARRDGFLLRARHVRPARRRGQHRHRRGRCAGADAGRARRRRRFVARRPRRGREAAGGGFRRQSQADLDAGRGGRLGGRRGPRVPAPRLRDQDDLDAVWGVRAAAV